MSLVDLVMGRVNRSHDFSSHERSPMPYAYRVVLMIPLTVIITFTVGGNLLTIIVMRLDKRLRSQPVNSMYIASLAGADLLVGTVVMTFMLLYTITFDGRWVFGSTMCTIWTCVDYLSCTASLTNVFLIAVDRYRSVSQPLKAIRRRTRRRASLFMAAAWLVPAFFWVSVICLMRVKTDEFIAARQARNSLDRIGGSHSTESNASSRFVAEEKAEAAAAAPDLSMVCDTRWDPPELAIVAVVVMFYIPLVAILVLFALIMCVLRRSMNAMTERIRRTLSLGNDNNSSGAEDSSAAYRQRGDEADTLVGGGGDKYRKTPTTSICTVLSSSVKGNAAAGCPTTTTTMAVHAAAVDFPSKLVSSSCLGADRKRDSAPEVREQLRGGGGGGGGAVAATSLKRSSKMETVSSIRFCSRNSETRAYAPSRDRQHSTDGGSYGNNGDVASKDGSSSCSGGGGGENTASSRGDAPPPLHWARNLHYAAVEMPRYQRYASQLRAQRQDSLQEVRLRQQIKAARIFGAITGFLLLCWIPFSVMLAVKAFCSDCLSQRTFDVAIWINYINSGINPIIYCLCNSHYRQALLKMARRAKCSRCAPNCVRASCD